MGVVDLISGRKLIEEVDSPYNGMLSVIYEVGWGKVIWGGGLPQSGGLAKQIWEKSLKVVKKGKTEVKSCLILGFGGGGISFVVNDLWPEAEIDGVDIDKYIVELGRKHLKWEKVSSAVVIEDAETYIQKLITSKKKYDLICVDMYRGNSVPEKFSKQTFVESVKKISNKNGVSVFNRLYGRNDEGQAHDFKKKIDKVYRKTQTVYPSANIMYICEA